MTRQEQLEFVSALLDSIKKTIQELIIDGTIPENWDGLELRQYIADRANRANYVPLGRTRKQKYNNTITNNNL